MPWSLLELNAGNISSRKLKKVNQFNGFMPCNWSTHCTQCFRVVQKKTGKLMWTNFYSHHHHHQFVARKPCNEQK